MPGKTATRQRRYWIFLIAELARSSAAGDRWLCAGRQSQLRAQRQGQSAGNREEPTFTRSGASPDAAKTARPGGPTNLRPAQSDRGTGVWSPETATRTAPVPASGPASSGNRVHAGGDWI